MQTRFPHLLLLYLLGAIANVIVVVPVRAGERDKTRFSEALERADPAGVRRDLEAGADPNELWGGHGLSALLRACSFGLLSLPSKLTPAREQQVIEVLEVLFQAGARLRTGGRDREILHGPAIEGAPRIAKYLLDHGADPNGVDESGNTPMTLAIEYGHDDLVSILIAGGAQPLTEAVDAQIRMVAAAGKGNLSAIEEQLGRGAQLDGRTPSGEVALVEAVKGGKHHGGNLPAIESLLKAGASPNSKERITGRTALHEAVMANARTFEGDNGAAVVMALLKAGAHVSPLDSLGGQTPLHIAAELSNAKAVELLITAGSKVMVRDELGKTPLDLAVSGEIIRALKAAGATER